MDLDTFIIAGFCWIDETLPQVTAGQPLRQRGPQPILTASEGVPMELVGEYLGLDPDQALFTYFQRHYAHFFPAVRSLHRTTFVRQAADLWHRKERRWQALLGHVPHAAHLAILDSFPLPVCQFARAYRCRRFRGEATFGKDTLVRQTFSGFRVHVRLEWPGVITRFGVAPANQHEVAMLPALVEQTQGFLIGDRNYWSPATTTAWRRLGVELLAPYRSAKRDPQPRWSARLSRLRYLIDPVFGQLVGRCQIKRVWARDLWHLANRLLRKVLMHTLAVFFSLALSHEPLHLATLVV